MKQIICFYDNLISKLIWQWIVLNLEYKAVWGLDCSHTVVCAYLTLLFSFLLTKFPVNTILTGRQEPPTSIPTITHQKFLHKVSFTTHQSVEFDSHFKGSKSRISRPWLHVGLAPLAPRKRVYKEGYFPNSTTSPAVLESPSRGKHNVAIWSIDQDIEVDTEELGKLEGKLHANQGDKVRIRTRVEQREHRISILTDEKNRKAKFSESGKQVLGRVFAASGYLWLMSKNPDMDRTSYPQKRFGSSNIIIARHIQRTCTTHTSELCLPI